MCLYCEMVSCLLNEEVISDLSWVWARHEDDYKINESEATKYTLGVFIDRGYLRLTDIDEAQCLDHGEKIKINFCPFCGKELK